LLFLGRMDLLKGGATMIDAVPLAARAIGRPLHVVFAGDGPERQRWESQARLTSNDNPGISIEFAGWVSGEERNRLIDSSDLIVLPSLWPEPFGLAGPEAAARGVPAAAFDVGGIGEWLEDGVNGSLAPGNPPTPEGLAGAIARCLQAPDTYEQMSQNALDLARRFSLDSHVEALCQVLASPPLRSPSLSDSRDRTRRASSDRFTGAPG
jgi:glycosyltransferase involved in cell wall biosynthesis